LRHVRRWQALLLILALALSAGGVLLGLLLRPETSQGELAANDAPPAGERYSAAEALHEARQLLARGQFELAVAKADAALAGAEALSASDQAELTQLHAEAALLAGLSDVSLEEILRHGAGLPGPEWEAAFARRYRGKAIVFDLELTPTAEGYQHAYRVAAGDREGRLSLEGLALLRALPRDGPSHVVFGARLASARREPPGDWVIRLVPGSGVLLTDAEAVAWCCPGLADADARALFERQRTWVLGRLRR
jgi:hypothetical protein